MRNNSITINDLRRFKFHYHNLDVTFWSSNISLCVWKWIQCAVAWWWWRILKWDKIVNMSSISFHQAWSLSRCHNYRKLHFLFVEIRHVFKIFIAFDLATLGTSSEFIMKTQSSLFYWISNAFSDGHRQARSFVGAVKTTTCWKRPKAAPLSRYRQQFESRLSLRAAFKFQ